MKAPEDVLVEITGRLRRTWSNVAAGALWAPAFHLGTASLSGRRLADTWSDVHRDAMAWEAWMNAADDGVSLERRDATVHGTRQSLPATLRVDSAETAARLGGPEWVARLARARARHAVLIALFADLADPAAVLRAVDQLSDVDFDLVCRTAVWFRGSHPTGLTARQIPVEGMGTKWLGAHESLVRRLAGLESLDLERGRPRRVHLTYLDAEHLEGGGRRHDLATHGDMDVVAYRPKVVLISENRDTAQLFPAVPGGIAVEGEGRAASTVAAFSWARDTPVVWYWGDMDADGLEILNGVRAAGLPARSLFMDWSSYERWERYGVDHDHGGASLGPRNPRTVEFLEPGERALYLALCSPDWSRHRRIEQERIPIVEAARIVNTA